MPQRGRGPEPGSRNDVTVWLACGCRVKVRNQPVNKRATYPCRSNMGHGYSQAWTRWEDGQGRTGENRG